MLDSLDYRLIYEPDTSKGLEVQADADFVRGFDYTTTKDLISVYLRTRYIIKYTKYLIIRKLKLQTKIALSTTKTEYNFPSTSLRETILIMYFLRKVSTIMNIANYNTTIKYTVFKDNNKALEVAKRKMRPKTKYIAIKYLYFCASIEKEIYFQRRLIPWNKKMIF